MGNSRIKKYRSIKEKKKKHDKKVMLVKSKLSSIDVLISISLINSNIGQDEFVLINNVLKERRNQKFKGLNSSSKNLVHS